MGQVFFFYKNFLLPPLKSNGASLKVGNSILDITRGGVTLHMTDYAPAYTKSVEKGSILDINVVDVFCKKGIFLAVNHTLGVPK